MEARCEDIISVLGIAENKLVEALASVTSEDIAGYASASLAILRRARDLGWISKDEFDRVAEPIVKGIVYTFEKGKVVGKREIDKAFREIGKIIGEKIKSCRL